MKGLKILFAGLLAIGCNDQPKPKSVKKVGTEFISFNYRNQEGDVIEFGRIVKESTNLQLIEGKISFDENYNTFQEITNNRIILESEIDSIKSQFKNKNYRENYDDIGKIVFVQLQSKEGNDFKVLNLRQAIEEKISKKLRNQNLGEWVAGDLGPGGANMLFEVNNWNQSFELIMRILMDEGLLQESLIVKRLYTAKDDWNYEVIYPIDYNGIFNQM